MLVAVARVLRRAGVCALLVLILVVAGCSGGSASGLVLARVGSRVVTKARFDHWLGVVAIVDYELQPAGPVPGWVVPDPPGFSRCITHLQGITGRPVTPIGTSRLKAQCAQRYQALREQVLGFLITGMSLIEEGHLRGLHVTASQVRRRFEKVKQTQFPSNAAFARYLTFTGETVSDELFRSEIKVASEGIEQQFLNSKGPSVLQREHALGRFEKAFPTRWAAKTTCHTGYVVPNCKEYKGPQQPRIII